MEPNVIFLHSDQPHIFPIPPLNFLCFTFS